RVSLGRNDLLIRTFPNRPANVARNDRGPSDMFLRRQSSVAEEPIFWATDHSAMAKKVVVTKKI
ncbi:hypothetical protein LTK58_26095, partial [Klebsiella quasipneumoniae subsp. quasipneumoniae]|nr:hypothetical protein [Klebsiella quasipneumoniae subsp. quasipneumoniae]